MKTPLQLVSLAIDARQRAYAPYSGYHTGAALLCADGTVYTGCNVENAAFSPSICAERVAFAKAVSAGAREFVSIAVVGARAGDSPIGASPCGVCLQVMQEFCAPATFQIHLPQADGTVCSRTLAEFLPLAFGADAFIEKEGG